MPAFHYQAVNASGQVIRGVMEEASEAAVVARLQRDGCLPMRAAPAARATSLTGLLGAEIRRRGLGRQDVTDLTRELATMLAAGQDLDSALRYATETARTARVRTALERVRAAVRDGSSLSAALEQQPDSFSRLYIGLARAGEAGGTLAPTLDRLATLLERQRRLAATVTSAMIYPALLLAASIGSIVLLLTQVLPQFVPLFQQNGASLPASTQFLITAGDLVSVYGLYALLGFAAALLAVRQVLRRPAPRLAADRFLLRMPLVGRLAREVLAARFTRTLGTLLLNGVPLIGALGITRDVVGNVAGTAAIDAAAASAKAGSGLSGPLQASGLFPLRTVYLIRLGEATAQLGAMALRAAEIHEEATRIGVQRLVALLVPAITILMGAAVAGIVSSLLLAMLSLNDLAN